MGLAIGRRRSFWLGRRLGGGNLFGKIVGFALDLFQRLLDIGIVRETLEDRFIFENGRGKLAHLNVRLRDPFGSLHHLLVAAEFGVGFFKDFQGLIITWLR